VLRDTEPSISVDGSGEEGGEEDEMSEKQGDEKEDRGEC
jgi:hypothetical protein